MSDSLMNDLADTFAAHEARLNTLGESSEQADYGTRLACALGEARSGGEPPPGGSLIAASRALGRERLLSLALLELGRALTTGNTVTLEQVREGFKQAVIAVVRAGGVRFGEGSLLDALLPASETLHQASGLGPGLRAAAEAARAAAERSPGPDLLAAALVVETLAARLGDPAT